LFRRGQAYENVGKIDEAFDDMKKVCELEKSNKGNLYNIKSKIIFEKIIIWLLFYLAAATAAHKLLGKKQQQMNQKMSQLKINVKSLMDTIVKNKEEKDNKEAIEGNIILLAKPHSI